MLRCAIAYGASSEIFLDYLKAFEKSYVKPHSVSVDTVIDKVLRQEPALLSLAELRLVNKKREADSKLRKDQAELVWRSALNWSTDAERELVEYWTQRMERYG